MPAIAKQPKGNGAKYTWILSPSGILCYPYHVSEQTLTNLWEVKALSAFHDADLAKATQQINSILRAVEKKNKDRDRKLSLIKFRNRHFLVWARYGAVGPDDDEATIVKSLRLKMK